MPLLGALSAIREVISKFFGYLVDKLGSSEFLQIVSEKQIQEELEKLKKELLEIHALLDDAEERGMMSKIKDIAAKLKDLEPRKNQLQLRMIDCSKYSKIKERRQPTSLEIETQVYGRDEDKKTILKLVLNIDDEGDFVSRWHGRDRYESTLAQLVYNDVTVHDHFDLKAWVCVSDDFDVTRITKAIFQAVTSEPLRNCDGLPLAAKTHGGLLRTNVNIDAWKDILKSEIWKPSGHRCGIIPALQLSYHHLPPHLKWFFAYCSILPKDYEFQEREIILLWRAEGLLQEARDKHSIEDLGHKYFTDLVARIEGDQKISKHARHLSYIGGVYDGVKKFEGIDEAVLYLEGYRISKLPDVIGDLKHLWYLDFSRTLTKCLPDSIGTLYNLETLLLREREVLEKLPLEMEILVNLCYLNITGANRLEGLKNVVETKDAWKAKLHDKSGLDKLELKWSKYFENRREEIEKNVLDLLQPSKNRKKLALKYYCGVSLAELIEDPSFNKLLSLCLDDCPNCTIAIVGKIKHQEIV
ncbi:putative disease resistance RPP13-like protein 1 [Durio zibethinus]|uniref:Disease resistance RPP13-like protein 1 n=1 Tax=Durio zibethinus TaxID=66656 RepID=A0A6P6AHM2_DURZI|nr:putative disease resistance RPP13-like protein 1 [Durio zibethinus]